MACNCCSTDVDNISRNGMCYCCELAGCSPNTSDCQYYRG